jgi:hypothetical protein
MSKQTWVETIITSIADGPTITAAGAVTCLPAAAKQTIQANVIQIGTELRIKASGRVSTVITTPGTVRYDVRLGGNVVFDSLAILPDTVAAHNTVGWVLDIQMICRAVGSGTSANFFGQGTWTCEDILGVPATAPKGVLTAILPWNSAPAVGGGFDSTVTNLLDLFFTQTLGTGSMTLHNFSAQLWN